MNTNFKITPIAETSEGHIYELAEPGVRFDTVRCVGGAGSVRGTPASVRVDAWRRDGWTVLGTVKAATDDEALRSLAPALGFKV